MISKGIVYEPEETELFVSCMGQDVHVFDVGANIGWYSMIATHACPCGYVRAFEPERENHRLLKENLWNASQGRWDTINVALTKAGVSNAKMFRHPTSGGHAMWKRSGAGGPFQAKAECLADHIIPCFPVNVLKIDTEGNVLNIMGGATTNFYKKQRPTLFIEFWPEAERQTGSNPRTLLEFLENENYTPFGIADNYSGSKRLDLKARVEDTLPRVRLGLNELGQFCSVTGATKLNLMLLPDEQADELP